MFDRAAIASRLVRPAASARGSALVVSLIFIVLITIVLVGFLTTTGLERKTVKSHYGKVQADLYSSMAVSVAASRIAQATSSTSMWWISQPGRIAATPFASSAMAPTTVFTDLSSGAASSAIENVSVELNPASLIQGSGVIEADPAVSLPVQWIYVREDGSQTFSPSAAPPYSATQSPLVGRYAFWTDDESGRINVNTALSRTQPQNEAANHPSRLDLTTISPLTSPDVEALREARNGRLFDSVEEVTRATGAPNAAAIVAEHKMAFTHFSHSLDVNRFREPRIVLTTQKSLAGDRPFLDILTVDNSDPGNVANISKTKIEALFAKLYPYFAKRACDWGLVHPTQTNFWNKTLMQKYGNDPRFAAQIILNLIDYVRSVESTQTLLLPTRGAVVVSGSSAVFHYDVSGYGATGNYGANAVRGNSRRIHIVEMGVWLPAATEVVNGANVYRGKVKLRIYLPRTVVNDVNIFGMSILPTLKPSTGGSYSVGEVLVGAANTSENQIMSPGQYRTLTFDVNIPPASGNTRPTQLYMRLAVKNQYGSSGYGYDLVPIEQSETLSKYARYNIDAAAVAESQMTSISISDPVVNQSFADWLPKGGSQKLNKFGTQDLPPESTLGTTAAEIIPQQDKDADARLTDISTLPPPPKGMPGNLPGRVGSVAELGKIHSGCAGTSVAGVPWRTLRLQPRYVPNGSLPDWVLLDLFAIPNVPADPADGAVLAPSTNSVGGRINLNSRLYPFSASQLTRSVPLRTVLRSANPALTEAEAGTLAENIANATLATGTYPGVAFGTADLNADALYSMVGEICEIHGIADTGEVSEEMVRGIFGFLADRGSVFSVFAVGEKIFQMPNGKILIQGTSRMRALLERPENGRVRVISISELGL